MVVEIKVGGEVCFTRMSKPLLLEIDNEGTKDFLETLKCKDDITVTIYTKLSHLHKY